MVHGRYVGEFYIARGFFIGFGVAAEDSESGGGYVFCAETVALQDFIAGG